MNLAQVKFISNPNHIHHIARTMVDQIKWLNSLFVRMDVNLFDDKGDDIANGNYWKVEDLDRLESWSIALVPTTNDINFVMKFNAGLHILPMLVDKRIKEVVYYKGNILHIRCETIDTKPYAFTIVVNNTMSPFSIVPFFKSL